MSTEPTAQPPVPEVVDNGYHRAWWMKLSPSPSVSWTVRLKLEFPSPDWSRLLPLPPLTKRTPFVTKEAT